MVRPFILRTNVLVLSLAVSCEAFLPLSLPGGSHRQSVLEATAFNDDAVNSRREMLNSFAIGALAALPLAANALDIDAFANSQIEADTKNCDPKKDPKCIPKLSADEALCKYGQSGTARGEACKRVKARGGELPSAKPQGKSLGGAYAM